MVGGLVILEMRTLVLQTKSNNIDVEAEELRQKVKTISCNTKTFVVILMLHFPGF